MILTNSDRAIVEMDMDDQTITKTFKDRLMFIKEKYAYETFPHLCVPLVEIKDMKITTRLGESLREWLKCFHNYDEKECMKKSIINLLKTLHAYGYCHCDVHIDNIIIYMGKPYLIDFEHLRCKSRDKFEEDIDIKGGGYVCAFDNSPRSIKTALGEFNDVK